MHQRHRSVVILVLALAITACASNQSGTAGSNRSVLTEQEIVATGYTDAFSTIQALRPQWLIVRGATSFSRAEPVQVYLDDQRYGGVESLRNVSVQQVNLIRYYTGIQASERWGLDHGNGAIQVLTHRGR